MTRKQLERWAVIQRAFHRGRGLGADKVRLLDGVDGWRWTRSRRGTAQVVEELIATAKANGGHLPVCRDLKRQNKTYLYEMARHKYPHLIKKQIHPESYYLVELRRLVKQNGGKVPSNKWLLKHRHFGVRRLLRKYPNKFESLQQDNENRIRRMDHVSIQLGIAKRLLARKKVLPSSAVLKKTGKMPLYSAIRLHREHFPLSEFPRTWALPKKGRR